MKLLIKILVIKLLLAATVSYAQQPAMTALETVENGVTQLLETVQEARPLLSQDENLYYAEIEAVLTDIVDFNAIARVVMSRYGNLATDAQINRFGDILKSTLTRFLRVGTGFLRWPGVGLHASQEHPARSESGSGYRHGT